MKKEFIVCYAALGVLILLCVIDVILGMWLNLICNTMWVIVEYTVLLSGKRHAENRRELREQELLNEKICNIIGDLAVDLGRESEVFDRIRKARYEAYNESLED